MRVKRIFLESFFNIKNNNEIHLQIRASSRGFMSTSINKNLLKRCLLLVVLFCCYSDNAAWNYFCEMKLPCKHLLCNPEILKGEPTFKAHVPLTYKIRRTWLESHNNIRNSVAGEKKATHMRNLIWDHEFAYIARVHTRQCPKEPSMCVPTTRFLYASMLTHTESSADPTLIATVMKNAIDAWKNNPIIVSDQVANMGCSIGYCLDKGTDHCYFATCVYEIGEMFAAGPESGDEAGSKCNIWNEKVGPKYQNLCRNSGKRFPINIKRSLKLRQSASAIARPVAPNNSLFTSHGLEAHVSPNPIYTLLNPTNPTEPQQYAPYPPSGQQSYNLIYSTPNSAKLIEPQQYPSYPSPTNPIYLHSTNPIYPQWYPEYPQQYPLYPPSRQQPSNSMHQQNYPISTPTSINIVPTSSILSQSTTKLTSAPSTEIETTPTPTPTPTSTSTTNTTPTIPTTMTTMTTPSSNKRDETQNMTSNPTNLQQSTTQHELKYTDTENSRPTNSPPEVTHFPPTYETNSTKPSANTTKFSEAQTYTKESGPVLEPDLETMKPKSTPLTTIEDVIQPPIKMAQEAPDSTSPISIYPTVIDEKLGNYPAYLPQTPAYPRYPPYSSTYLEYPTYRSLYPGYPSSSPGYPIPNTAYTAYSAYSAYPQSNLIPYSAYPSPSSSFPPPNPFQSSTPQIPMYPPLNLPHAQKPTYPPRNLQNPPYLL